MGGANNAAVKMYDFNQKKKRESPQFQNGQIDAGRHDDKHVTGVYCVIFNSFQDNKIVRLFL